MASEDCSPVGPLLAAFDKIAETGGAPDEIALKQLGFIRKQIETDAGPFFRECRDARPILVTPLVTLVTRYRDVEEILHRESVFSVEGYTPHMTGVIGPFILSLDVDAQYDHDKAATLLAVRRNDLAHVKEIVAHAAGRIVGGIGADAPFDIVQHLTRVVPTRLAAAYFGFSAATDSEMMGWARACFWEFFQNLDNNAQVRKRAVEAGQAMRVRVAELIAAARAGQHPMQETVLKRLLRLQAAGAGTGFDDEGIFRTIAGLVIGMIETTSQAAVQALTVLLAQPDLLSLGADAARAGDDGSLWRILREALRFRPINPLVMRIVKRDYRLGSGSSYATDLSAGRLVFACTASAMFDERKLDVPDAFRADRPDDVYLHFATGQHGCFGRFISEVQITQILKPLLARPELRAVGTPSFEGPFPDRFEIAVGA